MTPWDHPELEPIKSLAMLKMEKNFRAQDKGYVRMPPDSFNMTELHGWVRREMLELDAAMEDTKPFTTKAALAHIREEIADVANCLDYLYESALRDEVRMGETSS